ncbi:MAG: hypothetical protein R3C26_04025 [Calditrichia bacterium]
MKMTIESTNTEVPAAVIANGYGHGVNRLPARKPGDLPIREYWESPFPDLCDPQAQLLIVGLAPLPTVNAMADAHRRSQRRLAVSRVAQSRFCQSTGICFP